MTKSLRPLHLYIHWPFCLSKCPYCDFNSHVQDGVDHEQWLAAYEKELEYFAASDFFANSQIGVQTIFFGGGTPSLMSPKIVEGIIKKISSIWQIDPAIEITLEANPTSFEAKKFKDFKQAGVNRVSVGVQSLIEDDLVKLGRKHSSKEAIEALQAASKIFSKISFDLIYARSGQSLKGWQQELKQAMELASGHISLYQLTIEKGTPFYKAYRDGDLILPENDVSADMYDWTNEYLSACGYNRYEISNYAKRGYECKHNLAYWNYKEYLGIGPGAHSRLGQKEKRNAMMMVHSPVNWLKSVAASGNGIQSNHELTQLELVEEAIMMGLRLQEGINFKNFLQNTGCNILDFIEQDSLDLFIRSGYIILDNESIRLTQQGLMMHNYIVSRIILH
jgi:oxygen-independent coproporphyrinogen-3 oxidase